MATNQDNLTAMTTINDITDLVQILQERPEWLQVIRGLVIGEELAQVPQRLDILDQRLAEFIEFVKQNTAAVNRRLEALEAHNRFMEARQTRTEDVLTGLLRDLATLKGFQTHSAALRETRRIAIENNCRQIRLLDDELFDLVESNDTADIVPGEQRSFVAADIVIEAERRDTGETCYIAIEVSFTAHEDDIRRAARNADFLTRFTGNTAIPVVAAAQVDPKVQSDFDQGPVQWYPISQADIEPE